MSWKLRDGSLFTSARMAEGGRSVKSLSYSRALRPRRRIMAEKHTTLPTFAPVPRLKDRSNGWKPEVQRAFIEALAELGSVKAACRRIGRADHGAYLLRRHPEAAEFRRAWDAALDIGMRRI